MIVDLTLRMHLQSISEAYSSGIRIDKRFCKEDKRWIRSVDCGQVIKVISVFIGYKCMYSKEGWNYHKQVMA